LLCEKCNVPSLYEPQSRHSFDLVQNKDLFLRITTGHGKTLILMSPLIAAQARFEEGIGIMTAPTKALCDQEAACGTKYGLKSWAISQDTLDAARLQEPPIRLFDDVMQAKGIRLVVMSPQMLNSEGFRKYEKMPKFRKSIRW
ncbi:hypothetical protein CPB85DRAFT_1174993, partial [Mucidula mucida]